MRCTRPALQAAAKATPKFAPAARKAEGLVPASASRRWQATGGDATGLTAGAEVSWYVRSLAGLCLLRDIVTGGISSRARCAIRDPMKDFECKPPHGCPIMPHPPPQT